MNRTKRQYNNETKDVYRLDKQIGRVFHFMKDAKWRTLEQIADATGDPEPSVSARLRDLRKRKFGSYTVRRKRNSKAFQYKLLA